MKRKLLSGAIAAVALLATVSLIAGSAIAAGPSGYNYNANLFVGTGALWCTQTDPTWTGCDAYLGASVNDILTMKWNAQWNNCNANGYDSATYCLGAWVSNDWNGAVPGGDGGVWHYKIIWVGSAAESSPYWLPGGYTIWNNYEVVMDQGTSGGVHTFFALATPNGYGAVNGQ
ncbi:MAG TPA: hypothetical protein VMV28_00490 [Thermoplasmata archaeon]|nr:hypothetical protein [Thermoplasmata archaeon]